MALKDIEEKIISDAEAESDSIISEAETKAGELIAKAKEDVRLYSQKEVKTAKASAEKETMQALSLARLAARDKVLSLKRQMISKVYQDSLDALGKLNRTDYEKIIAKTLGLVGQLPARVDLIGPKDKAKQTEDSIKRARIKLRLATEFKFTEKTFDGAGGFILSTPEMRIDGTFEGLLDGLKKDIEPEIVKTLFGEEK